MLQWFQHREWNIELWILKAEQYLEITREEYFKRNLHVPQQVISKQKKNKTLFTEDGWIHTGDVAVRYTDGKYRIFGRATDCFVNSGVRYAMYDIEERVLEHPGVAEAEVIKFEIEKEEYPAIVVVVNNEWKDRLVTIVKDLCSLDVSGMEYLKGIRFVNKFKTNPVTSKRDYVSLQEERQGYYFSDKKGQIYRTGIDGEKILIADKEIRIAKLN